MERSEPGASCCHEILVVDDTLPNLQLLTDIFSEEGYRVRQATNGQVALRSVAVKVPDLILLDVSMPDMDGYEVCRRLKSDERTRGIPVIFLSAYQESTEKMEGFRAGGVDFITKPFAPAEVLARVVTHLRLRELTERLEQKVSDATRELTAANQQLRAALTEKDVLLREIHHRVKNNLQIISCLLDLHSGTTGDSEARRILLESRNRIGSMAMIHEMLYETSDFCAVNFGSYLERLTRNLHQVYLSDERVALNVDAGGMVLGLDEAIPCGLIVNELVSNALKYAFPDGRRGTLTVRMHKAPEGPVTLDVADDGAGFPPGLDFRNTETLGLQLVVMLVRQLKGSIDLERGCGTLFRIQLPGSSPGAAEPVV